MGLGCAAHAGMEVAPKRSTRAKKSTDKVRIFDANTRAEIRKKKLDALEADNWHEEKPRAEEEDDEEYMDDEDDEGVAVGASSRSKKKKKPKKDIWNATQKCKPLQVRRAWLTCWFSSARRVVRRAATARTARPVAAPPAP